MARFTTWAFDHKEKAPIFLAEDGRCSHSSETPLFGNPATRLFWPVALRP